MYIPSLSNKVKEDTLFPMPKLAPEVTKSNATVKFSSNSTSLSGYTVTDAQTSAPPAEPLWKVISVDIEP